MEFYLSQDDELSGDDVLLNLAAGGDSIAQGSIAGNSLGELQSVDLILPNSLPGGFSGTDFFVLTSVDAEDEIAETNESNNSGRAKIWGHDDLTITTEPVVDIDLRGWWTRVDTDSQNAFWGESITLDKVQVQNLGTTASGTFNLQWYLSQDSTLSGDDVLLNLNGGGTSLAQASIDGNSLGTLQSVQLELPGSLPVGFSGSDFFILTSVDAFDAVAETNENNNSGRALIWDHDNILVTSASPLLAAGGEAAVASSQVLTTADLDPLLDDAIAAWSATGISESQLARLEGLQVGIADLTGARLGEQIGNTITIDVNAAGYGWHTSTNAPTADRMDLLTVIYHEMGHALGLEDDYSDPNSDDIMNGWLQTGTRREPTADDLDSLFASDLALEEALS